MPDTFVPLGAFLRRSLPDEPSLAQAAPAPPTDDRATEGPSPEDPRADVGDALAAARRFRAALADALDAAVEELARGIACDVLARELALAPADLAAIVAGALERYAADLPLRVRAHPADSDALAQLDLPIVADSSLGRGDVVIDLRSGSIDVSLGARLESVLEA